MGVPTIEKTASPPEQTGAIGVRDVNIGLPVIATVAVFVIAVSQPFIAILLKLITVFTVTPSIVTTPLPVPSKTTVANAPPLIS